MLKKILLLFFFFAIYRNVYASLEINEIMYDLETGDDGGREWIEIFNNGDKPVDASTFKFFEGDTNHKLKLVDGNGKIEGGGYVIIAADAIKFKTAWPSFTGNIFDSTFSLSNDGETLALKNEELSVDQYTYSSKTGGAGNGESLQKIRGTWISSKPTPGEENKIEKKVSVVPVKAIVAPKVAKAVPSIPATKKEDVPPETLLAQTVVSESSPPEVNNSSFASAFFIAPVIFIGLGAYSVYLIRRKKVTVNEAENFEILEE